MQINTLSDGAISRSVVDGNGALDSLSPGQRDVLEVLTNRFETNKEIAQKLGIAPSTVKQRLDAAARKLGTRGRYATKLEYERVRGAYVPMVYPPEHLPILPLPPQQPPRDWGASPTLHLDDAMPFDRIAPWASVEQPTGLEAFVEKLNALPKVTILVTQAVLLSILSVGGLTAMGTFQQFVLLRFVTQ